MNTRRTLLAAAAATGLSLSSAGAALGSTTLGGMRADNYSSLLGWTAPSDTFYLQSANSRQILDFKNVRRVRICDEAKTRGVDLDVKHAGDMTEIKPGECAAVEGGRVALKPAGHLPFGMSLTGKVEPAESAQTSG